MVLNPFQVRLKDNDAPEGFRLGLVGTVVGMVPIQKQEGGIQEIYKVLWYSFDEDTGEMNIMPSAPAPSSHFAEELVAHVDEFDDLEDDEEDEDGFDDFEDDEQDDVDNPEQIKLQQRSS